MSQIPIHAVTPYGRSGGSSRVRVFDWLDHLHLEAVSHDYAGLAANTPRVLGTHPLSAIRAELDLRNLRSEVRHTTLILSRQASPFSRGRLEEGLLSGASRGVYDFDDSLLDVVSSGFPQSLFSKSRIWLRAIRSADVVIAGNDYLAGQASKVVGSNRIVVIPSCVDPSKYGVKKNFEIGGAPRAVWLGSPSTEKHLLTAADALLSIHESHGLRLSLISSGNRDLGPLSRMVDRVEWRPGVTQVLAEADLGLMPLPDTPFTRGKCAYKLLQYGASALPAIASPVGVNRDLINAGGAVGAQTTSEWVEALTVVLEETPAQRSLRGQAARAVVTTHFSFSAWEDAWFDAVTGQ